MSIITIKSKHGPQFYADDLYTFLDSEFVSDSYHTMDELYEHRMMLFVALLKVYASEIDSKATWISQLHNDGTMFDGGWFVAGIETMNREQITYHLKIEPYWNLLKEHVTILEKSPEWDGHTSEDVLERLKEL